MTDNIYRIFMNSLTFFRILRTGWNNFIRNRWLALATIFVMILTIFTMTVLIFLSVIGGQLLTILQNKIDVSVYLKQETADQDIKQMQADLLSLGEVKKVTFVSSEDALAEFKKKHESNQTLMDSLKELGNPLLPAVNIEAQSASQYDSIINFLEQGKYKKIIDKINYQQNKPLIERLMKFSNTVKRSGIIVSIILAIIAGLVTFNTIRLALYNFREEIGVMKLVGASSWFARGPFLVEGVIYGIIAAAATMIIIFPIIYFFSPKISLLVPGLDMLAWLKNNFLSLLFMQLAIGILLGGVSSMVAIRKYLRV
ncbi:MAG: hypothetical protein UT31_C0011G0004 [Parcubacteria group bacterium GW2011_GWF2_39_13b]|nr:MAG: hypothetical protein UT31_C0011G0004 [Parcubacteria group bacterium GW2011_GWF2_39_13b]